jgi:hypothetical protein
MPSSVSVQLPSYGYVYTFSGVISIQHEFSLKIQTESESASGSDYVNGARNKPDKIILSIIETDVDHVIGWSDQMLQAMEAIKRTRTLCNVITPAKMYSAMLLSEFVATVDETSQSGWKGTLTFVQYVPPAVQEKTADNASTAVHTGSTGTVQTVSGTSLQNLLDRAGVR